MCGKPYRGFESHSLRQYIVLHCSPSFEIPSKISDLLQKLCTSLFSGVLPSPRRDRSFCPWVRRTVSPEKGIAGRLNPLDIQRQEKPGKYADGDGLYLVVTGPTSKNWSYRYWFKGKERWLGLGSFKESR